MEQKTIIFSRASTDYIGSQLKDTIDINCIDGWYCHQIQPTYLENSPSGERLQSAVIILHRKKIKQTNFIG